MRSISKGDSLSSTVLRVEKVSKQFRRGELFDSLRDLLPALARQVWSRQRATSTRTFWALQDVSFEVHRGEAFGMIGSNGAGKSTMLKLVSRIMRPTTGTIEVDGRISALIEVSAGFHPDLTGRENIFLNGTILGMSRQEIQSRLDQIVEFSGLDDFIDTPVKRYSSGMFARLGFSVAAHVRPDLLIVDEVLSVGDYLFQQKCVARMREVIREGATVLFVSHNLKLISDFCTRCLVLDRGRIVDIGDAGQMIRSYMNRLHGNREVSPEHKPVTITKVRVRDENGECVRLESGQRAWIDIEITAHSPCSKLAVVLYVMDERHQNVFDTSTERLGHGSVTLGENEVFSCTFELQMNFVSGIFYPSVAIYRYDIQREYDTWAPAATIHMSTDRDARGIVNCFPRLTHQEIRAAVPSLIDCG